MFELPNDPSINEIVINQDVIKKKTNPLKVHGEKKSKKSMSGNPKDSQKKKKTIGNKYQ